MNPAELVILALRSIAVLTNNVAIGGGGIERTKVSEWLDILAGLIELGEDGYSELRQFTAEVAEMAKNNYQPTSRDFDRLKSRSDAAHARIQAFRQPEPEPEPTGDDGGPAVPGGAQTEE